VVLVLGLLCVNLPGCDGNASAVSEKKAVRLAREHYLQEFPNLVYDDVYIKPGTNGSWITEFRIMEGRDAEDLDGGKKWLKSPVFIIVDSTGNCEVRSNEAGE